MLALLLLAKVDDVSGGRSADPHVPAVLVFIVAGLWAFSLRHFGRDL